MSNTEILQKLTNESTTVGCNDRVDIGFTMVRHNNRTVLIDQIHSRTHNSDSGTDTLVFDGTIIVDLNSKRLSESLMTTLRSIGGWTDVEIDEMDNQRIIKILHKKIADSDKFMSFLEEVLEEKFNQ